MSSDIRNTDNPPLDLSRWRSVPAMLIVVGAIFAAIGVLASEDHTRQFAFSWLLAFMFFFSLGVGGWFLTMVHHLFDASWSVPIRRVPETLATMLAPPLLVLFLPIAILAPHIYPWLQSAEQSHPNHALLAKYPLFTAPGYYIAAAALFAVWWFFSSRLRYWSVQQDSSGSAQCTHKMRVLSCLGIVCFALSVTLAAIMWMKGLMDEWYSTMYGVCYFAASVWTALPTVYVIVLILQRKGDLKGLVGEKTYYFLGSLFFAFTVFWAYVNFAQYFIIWNANMPEETFWYNLRENGTWNYVGKYVIIFGHFFVPFLMLLRIDWKLKLIPMIPLALWAWLMHFVDIEFQIMPALHTDGILTWGLLSDIGCVLLFAGILTMAFVASFKRQSAYPLKDPRMAEALDLYVPIFLPHFNRAGARQMNPEPPQKCCRVCATVVAIVGTFLVMVILVAILRHYTVAPAIAADRAAERMKILDDFNAVNTPLLTKYDWQDKDKGFVRVPVARAKELVLEEWQNPVAARSNLMERAAKAFAPAPKPPEKKSVYE